MTEPTIPLGWAIAPLKDLVGPSGVLCDGDWVESKDQDPEGDVRLIQLADIGDGVFKDKSNRFLTGSKAADLGCTYLRSGDVLISRLAEPLGRACIFPGIGQPAVTAVDVCILRAGDGNDHILAPWLMNAINSAQFRRRIDSRSSGTTRKRISRRNLETLEIEVPPVNEQQRIVAKIEELTTRSRRAREALEAVPPLLEQLRQSVLAAAFSGRLTADWRAKNPDVEPASVLLERIRAERRRRWEENELAKLRAKGKEPKDDRWKSKYEEPEPIDPSGLPDLPESWAWSTLNELACLITDGDHNPPKRVEFGIPHLTAKAVKNWSLTTEGCSYLTEEGFAQTRARYEPAAGDLIITCVGTVGETAVVPEGMIFSADRNLAAVRLIQSHVLPYIVQAFLNAPTLRSRLLKGSGANAQPHLYLKEIRSIPVPMPPWNEQAEIQQLLIVGLRHLSSIADELATASAELQVFDQSILAKAFRGELVPQDPNDEPASVLLERIRAQRASADGGRKKGRSPRAVRSPDESRRGAR